MGENPVYIFAVADGMGGLSDGEKAATEVLADCFDYLTLHLIQEYRVNNLLTKEFLSQLLVQSIQFSNKCLLKKLKNMVGTVGTTLSIVLIYKNGMYSINIGDSPIYIFQNKELFLISEIHNVAADMKKDGLHLTDFEEEMFSSTLTHYMGTDFSNLNLSTTFHLLHSGDQFIIGSDGAFSTLNEKYLKKVLVRSRKKVLSRILSESRKYTSDNQTICVGYL